MTDNNYKYFSQTKFNGGIETREELIEDSQVLDARNYWVQSGDMVQRPGVSGARLQTGISSFTLNSNFFVGVSAGFYVKNTDGTITEVTDTGLPGSYPTSLDWGNTWYDGFSYCAFPGLTLEQFKLAARIQIGNLLGATAATNFRFTFEVYTERGWLVQHVDNPYPLLLPTSGGANQSPFYVNIPTDVLPMDGTDVGIPELDGAIGFRLRLISGSISAIFNAASSLVTVLALNTSAIGFVPTFAGAASIQFASGRRIISLFKAPPLDGGPDQPSVWFSKSNGVSVSSSIANTLFFSQGLYGLKIPPTFAVIPEFNQAYVAFNNIIYSFTYAGNDFSSAMLSPITYNKQDIATVNTDPLIVGPISTDAPASPYPSDQIPQLSSFPPANLIAYFSNQLWVAGIQGQPTTVRWSGSASEGAYNVWPETSQSPLSTAQDNSEITALAPLGDNMVVFKKNSIWQMIDAGVDDNGLNLYEPRLVVTGVGTVAPNSVKPVNGGLMFLGEDGFYFFDGTPNIKRLSDPVKTYISDINPARAPFAQGVVWRTKQHYICAVSSRGEDQNNDLIFAYDIQNGGWQVWTGWDVQCWLQIDGVGLEEELWWTDSYGRAYQVDRKTQSDNGAEIDSWFITTRWGFNDVVTKTSRELRVRGDNNNPDFRYSVIGDDIEVNVEGSSVVDPVTSTIVMPRDDEQRWDDPNDLPVSGVSAWVPTRRRERKSANRTTASWFQVKIYKLLRVFGIDLGWTPEGRR